MAHRTPSVIGEVQLRKILGLRLNVFPLLIGQRNEPIVAQVAELADGRVTREFCDVLADAGNHSDVRFLYVEEQRPRDGILAVGNRLKGRDDAVDVRALYLVLVLCEEAVTEDPKLPR